MSTANTVDSMEEDKQQMFEQSVEALNLRSYNFYRKEIGMTYDIYKKMSKNLSEIGNYEYGCDKLTNVKKIVDQFGDGIKRVYVGEVSKQSPDKAFGKGITVNDVGDIYQGLTQKHLANGYGRKLSISRDYEIGNWKNDKRNGYFYVF